MVHLLLLHFATDSGPEPKDVKAGWTAFVVFILMFIAVIALGFSMARQFKRARSNRDTGVLPADKSDEVVYAPVVEPGNSADR